MMTKASKNSNAYIMNLLVCLSQNLKLEIIPNGTNEHIINTRSMNTQDQLSDYKIQPFYLVRQLFCIGKYNTTSFTYLIVIYHIGTKALLAMLI